MRENGEGLLLSHFRPSPIPFARHSAVAQLAERAAVTREVGSSSLPGGAYTVKTNGRVSRCAGTVDGPTLEVGEARPRKGSNPFAAKEHQYDI